VGKVEQGERRLDVIEYVSLLRSSWSISNQGIECYVSKTNAIIATLSSGDRINVRTARDVGNYSIEIVGTNDRKVQAVVSTVSFEVIVVDTGTRRPNLHLIEDENEEDGND